MGFTLSQARRPQSADAVLTQEKRGPSFVVLLEGTLGRRVKLVSIVEVASFLCVGAVVLTMVFSDWMS